MNIIILIIIILLSFYAGYLFGKFKTKEKYENKVCFFCGHSEKENHIMEQIDKGLKKLRNKYGGII